MTNYGTDHITQVIFSISTCPPNLSVRPRLISLLIIYLQLGFDFRLLSTLAPIRHIHGGKKKLAYVIL